MAGEEMRYFPLILFVPAALIAWAAIVANAKDKEPKLTPAKAILVFFSGVAILLPISVWNHFFSWLSRAVFHSN